jgi:hypothetical protein
LIRQLSKLSADKRRLVGRWSRPKIFQTFRPTRSTIVAEISNLKRRREKKINNLSEKNWTTRFALLLLVGR